MDDDLRVNLEPRVGVRVARAVLPAWSARSPGEPTRRWENRSRGLRRRVAGCIVRLYGRSRMVNDTHDAVFTLEQAASYLLLTAGELIPELESGRIPALNVAGQWR